MANEVAKLHPGSVVSIDPDALSKLILNGDLSGLTPTQKVQYYNKVCESVGLNPLTQPFKYLKLQGKEVLYADKSGSEQLRKTHKISLRVVSRETINDVYVVTTEATLPDGRVDSSTGAVPIAGLKGDALANAMMKAETKSKRRVTLSICGLGMLDETEVETIPGVVRADQPMDGDGIVIDKGYVIDFGKWNRRTLEQVYSQEGPAEIASYITYLEGEAKKKGASPGGKVAVFIKEAEQFLGAMENGPEAGDPGAEG